MLSGDIRRHRRDSLMCVVRTSLPCNSSVLLGYTGRGYPLRWWAMQLRFSMGGGLAERSSPAEFNGCRPARTRGSRTEGSNSKSLVSTCFNYCNPITRDCLGMVVPDETDECLRVDRRSSRILSVPTRYDRDQPITGNRRRTAEE